MRGSRRIATTWVVLLLLVCSTFSVGCDRYSIFGNGMSLNFVVPLGLSGTPGLLNPFGIIQAAVNALLGVGATTGGTSGSGDTPSGAASPASAVDPAIGVVIN